MTSTPHLIDNWFWLPRTLAWQGFNLVELQKYLAKVPKPGSNKVNLTLFADL